MQSSLFNAPIGFRFHPTDSELVCCYLYNKVKGNPLPCGVVEECDLYGSQEPWEIWESYGGGMLEEDQDLYFFTHLKKKSGKGKRICRTVGSGTWQGEDSAKEIMDRTQKVVGWKKRFRYEKKCSDSDLHNGAWLMHEYSLLGDCDQMVLCRIRKNIVEAAQGGGRGRKRKRNLEYSQEPSLPVPLAADHHDQTELLLEAVSECDHWVTLEQLFPLTDDHQFPSTSTSTSTFTDDDLLSVFCYFNE